MNEKNVKDKVKKLCKEYGAYYAMPVMKGMAQNGTPDLLICHRGLFIGCETKYKYGKPSALQIARLHEIQRAGGIAVVINERNIELLKRIFEREPGYQAEAGDTVPVEIPAP